MRVLIADDDIRLGPLLVEGRAGDSIHADLVSSGREAIIRARTSDHTAVETEVDPSVLEAGDPRLDASRHQVHRGDTPISLSRKELAVLETLMYEPGRDA